MAWEEGGGDGKTAKMLFCIAVGVLLQTYTGIKYKTTHA